MQLIHLYWMIHKRNWLTAKKRSEKGTLASTEPLLWHFSQAPVLVLSRHHAQSHTFSIHAAFIRWLRVTGKYTVLLHEYLSGLEVTANSLPPECVAEKMFISCSSTSILKTLEAYMCMICSQYGHSQSPFSWFVNFKTMKIYGEILLRPTTWISLILTFSPWYLKHSVKCRKTFYLT